MAESTEATRIEIAWTGGERFTAVNRSGVELTLAGGREEGFSPTETLLASLAACMGIDVVLILKKMRAGLQRLRVVVDGERTERPPRFFRRVRLHFEIEGAVPRERAERAVKLSFDKYCSVFHTLRKDLVVETSIELTTPPVV